MLCGSQTSVDIGLGSLCAHLLGRKHIAVAEFLHGFVVSVQFEVGHVAQVGAFLHGAQQSLFVNHLLAGTVDEDGVGLHALHQVVADGADGRGRGRNVQAHDVVVEEEGLARFVYVVASVNDFLRTVERRIT